MKPSNIFFCAVLLGSLALAPGAGLASPMLATLGDAHVTLVLSPDPPQPGMEQATVTVDGVSQGLLTKTTVTFGSTMPAMNMSGVSGTAAPVLGKPGSWTFRLPTSMATQYTVDLRFSGGLIGSTSFAFGVAGGSSAGANGAIAGMSSGHEDAWRNATIALAILFALSAFAAWQVTRSLSRSGRLPSWANRSVATLAAVALVVVIGAVVLQTKLAPPSMDMAAMSNVQGSAPVPVTLARAQSWSGDPTIAAPGVIQAYLNQDVAARAPGILRDFTAYVGTRVFAGETLAFLEEPELGAQAQAALAGARSDMAAAHAAMIEAQHHAPNELAIAEADARAKAERERYWQNEIRREKILLDNGAVSQQEYQDERAQAAAAAADAEAARHQVHDAIANLEMTQQQAISAQEKAASSSASAQAAAVMAGYTRIIAPDDGVVVKRLVDPGTYVQAGTPVLRLAVIGKARIQANVAQEDLQFIRVGSPLEAKLPDGRVIRARLTSKQPAADPTTHTAQVEAIVDNPNGQLIPGTYVRVVIRGIPSHVRNAVNVPSAAIVGAGADAFVWIDVNGTAHRVRVHVVSDDGTTAQLLGDLKSGDRVVVEGAQDLEEGMLVTERSS